MFYPTDLGFKMPPEWAKRQQTFIEFPIRKELWENDIIEAKTAYSNIAKIISEFEKVTMIVDPANYEDAKKYLSDKIEILQIEHNDSWIRDNGPTFITNDKNEIAGICWLFNSWGEKYKPYDKDKLVAKKIIYYLNIPCFEAPIVLEGGAIHTNGNGTLLTTEQCLLNKNRNPDLSKDQIFRFLKRYLGIQKIIWLKNGLYGDETDGHIDNIACFTSETEILIQVCENDETDPNYQITQENLKILEESIDVEGRKFKIHKIHQPPKRFYKNQRLTLSYINYYLVNGGLILPTFGEDAKYFDDMAESTLQKIFPDRKIIRIDGMPIIKGGGNVHCITQQMPAISQTFPS
ncbi:MAG: agmatine deiminase [Spirochaetes bacterium GWD1_27_9]|nr:MAG: agmatine deiminase [Spirochaetes bacterium GWB1_27_13]OHD21048.1 MAG: agmatine deiminase [Spirochaetes bacterium GWC1_27_15]OHD45409.1 MAG: agmatine deiminase [Spirochaetes bacterium GWD1_27_9]